MKTHIKKVSKTLFNVIDILLIIYIVMCVIIAGAKENALIFFVYPLPAVIYFMIREGDFKRSK